MPESEKKYFQYWGKATKTDDVSVCPYHLLPYHSLDVAAVGSILLSHDKPIAKDLSEFLDLDAAQLQGILAFALALHDIGKFSSAFQKLYKPDGGNLHQVGMRTRPYDGANNRHDRLGLFFWEDLKKEVLPELLQLEPQWEIRERTFDSLNVLLECVLGHHGKPINSSAPRSIKPFTETHNIEAAREFCVDLFDLFSPNFPLEMLKDDAWRARFEQASWQFAGLAVLADWLGSDNAFFEYNCVPMSLEEYWPIALSGARDVLESTELGERLSVNPYRSMQEHFGFLPTPLQQWAETVPIDTTPQLFILEDVTGAGKTEAALALTHRLMAAGAADGFYFGLPTMATSNTMFNRVADHYLQMLSHEGRPPSIVLAHGASEMNDRFKEAVLSSQKSDSDYSSNDATATAQCNLWLSDSRKKALLAPVGVGTIDQALLAVLPRRHQSLRMLGLYRKVLIFDEVHAADEYMFKILGSLLSLHLHQGGSAILLTATLSKVQRSRLVAIWRNAGNVPIQVPSVFHFPLATKVTVGADEALIEQPLDSRVDVSREVAIQFVESIDECLKKIQAALADGKCVVWVRNSVDDAVGAYHKVCETMDDPDDCFLFHSRFVLEDRKRIESLVIETFGKTSGQNERRGKVLIATQVFQESLDVDTDLLISDICPIDDLIQRAGRLHRHTRDDTGIYRSGITDSRETPALLIHAPQWCDDPEVNWLSEHFQSTQYVYKSSGRLWLGMKKLMELGSIKMPDNARELIEAVYGEDAVEHIPENLLKQEQSLIGSERAIAAKAHAQILKWDRYGYCDRSATAWYEDNTDISTRHSEIETVEVLLLKTTETGALISLVSDPMFGIQLSTVKLSKRKFADNLAPTPKNLESALELFQQRIPKTKYMQVWIPEIDQKFTYSPNIGFCERQELEEI